MTVLENMQAVLPSLPKNERKAAEYLLNYPHDIQRRSAEIIAQDAGISRSAIVRLCQKLGYQGWSEFKYAYLHEPALAASAQEHNILTRYENIIQKLRQGVSADQPPGQSRYHSWQLSLWHVCTADGISSESFRHRQPLYE